MLNIPCLGRRRGLLLPLGVCAGADAGVDVLGNQLGDEFDALRF